MPWGRWDDQLYDNGKVMSFSDKAYRLWGNSISYANRHRTHGRLTQEQALYLARAIKGTRRTIDELVAKRGWDRDRDGYTIHDFGDYNDKADPTAAERAARYRANGRHERDASVTDTVTATVTEARDDRDARHDPVPVPNPVSQTPPPTPREEARSNARVTGPARASTDEDCPVQRDEDALVAAFKTELGYADDAGATGADLRAELAPALTGERPLEPQEVPALGAYYDRTRSASVPRTARALVKAIPEFRRASVRAPLPPAPSRDPPAGWTSTWEPGSTHLAPDLPSAFDLGRGGEE